MKFIIYSVLIVVGICSACYDDKGSSDYGEKLNIRVENVETNIRVNVASVLEICPKIYPENREYECFWGIANKNNQYSIIDTLCKEKDLNFFVDLKTGSYLLRFCAKDVETGIFSYTEYNLSVETDMATGWWVLKNGVNGTDIDLFTPDKKIADVLYSRNGHSLMGSALDMSYTNYYWVYDSATGNNVMTKAIFVGSDQDLAVIDFFTGQFISEFDELFYGNQKQRKIQALFRGASDTHVVVNDQIYTMPNMKYAPYRQFAIKHLGTYEISSYRNASGSGLPLLFDKLTSSFCTVSRNLLELNYFGNDETLPHQNLDMDLLFLGGRTIDASYPGEYAYAILKKKNAEEYWLAYLNGWQSMDKNPMEKELRELPNTLGVLRADFRAMNQDNDIIYFSKNNKLFSCDLATLYEKEQNLDLASGEVITYMEYIKYFPWDMINEWFTYLVIGITKGEQYKLCLHPVQAGNIQPAIKIFEGIGEVKRAIYIETSGNGNVNISTFF